MSIGFFYPHVFKNSCVSDDKNKKYSAAGLHLQEHTKDDLTHTVSQDQPSIGFATSYSPAHFKKSSPCGVFFLFLRRKISTLHFNERHSVFFPHPQTVSCANPLTFVFFLNQLNLHFTEPSQAYSFSACETGLFWGSAGVHIWLLELPKGARTESFAA